MHEKPIIPHVILSDIGNKNGLVSHSNRKVNQSGSRSRISVDTSAFYYTSQTYRKQNRNRKQNRSVQCGHTVKLYTVIKHFTKKKSAKW